MQSPIPPSHPLPNLPPLRRGKEYDNGLLLPLRKGEDSLSVSERARGEEGWEIGGG
jgi:hypothetical protein